MAGKHGSGPSRTSLLMLEPCTWGPHGVRALRMALGNQVVSGLLTSWASWATQLLGYLSPSPCPQGPAWSTPAYRLTGLIWGNWPVWSGCTPDSGRVWGRKSQFPGSQNHCKREDWPISRGEEEKWFWKDRLESKGEAYAVQCPLCWIV